MNETWATGVLHDFISVKYKAENLIQLWEVRGWRPLGGWEKGLRRGNGNVLVIGLGAGYMERLSLEHWPRHRLIHTFLCVCDSSVKSHPRYPSWEMIPVPSPLAPNTACSGELAWMPGGPRSACHHHYILATCKALIFPSSLQCCGDRSCNYSPEICSLVSVNTYIHPGPGRAKPEHAAQPHLVLPPSPDAFWPWGCPSDKDSNLGDTGLWADSFLGWNR